VDNLTEVVSSLDKLGQGDYALRLLALREFSVAELAGRRLLLSIGSLWTRCAPIIEETHGNLSAFLRDVPGQPAVQRVSAVAA
jgi:type IV secretion system protein VirB4